MDGVGPVFGNAAANTSLRGGVRGVWKKKTDKSERWLVWDWCDAGHLKGLIEFYGGGVGECVIWGLPSGQGQQQKGNEQLKGNVLGDGKTGKTGKKGKKGILPRKEDMGTVITQGKPSQVVKRGAGGFLPESLVWHVAIGVLRALMFLHEGKRDVISVEKDAATGQFKRVRTVKGPPETEPDWLPILHRDIRAENIYLQHPRGIETYGQVKLGGFEQCYVSGSVVMEKDEEELVGERVPLVAMERDLPGDVVDEKELRNRWLEWEGREEGDVIDVVSPFSFLSLNDNGGQDTNQTTK